MCAAIVFACAPRTALVGAADDDAPEKPSTDVRPSRDGGFGATVINAQDNGQATFTFAVTNYGERTEVRFASGQTHDFVVLDEREREVWRWSDGRLFTQSLQTRQVRTGDVMRFEGTWRDARPGTYHIVAVLNSDTHPQQVSEPFVVR